MLMRAKVLKSPLFLLWETVWLPGLKTPATSSSQWEEGGKEDKRQFDLSKIVLFTAESGGIVQWALCIWLMLTTDRMCLVEKCFCIDWPQWIKTWVCVLHVLFLKKKVTVLKVRNKSWWDVLLKENDQSGVKQNYHPQSWLFSLAACPKVFNSSYTSNSPMITMFHL